MTKLLQTHTVPAAALVALILAGCVTINIYFPASAAEKAADTIIDEVWRMKSKPAADAPPTVPNAQASPAAPKEKTP
jgi:hypothetical protein